VDAGTCTLTALTGADVRGSPIGRRMLMPHSQPSITISLQERPITGTGRMIGDSMHSQDAP
jgi:hypothetical protein